MGTALARTIDTAVYPSEDGTGETEWHRAVCLLLWLLVRRWAREKGLRAHVGSNQFVYWAQHEPTKNLAPDLYVVPGLEVGPEGLDVLKTWEDGVPSLVVEIVSTDWRKDYEDSPRRCAEMGVRELIVFDAKAPRARQPERVRWQVFRRVARRGLVRVEVGSGDRVRSKILGAWLRTVAERGSTRVRIGTGENGDVLLPTDDEALAAERDGERLRANAAQRREHAAQRREEAAQRQVERSEAELARLRAELEALRRR